MPVTKQHISGGDGKSFPSPGDWVVCEYRGAIASTGAVFDASHGPGGHGGPLKFEVGVRGVVLALDEGIRLLSVGEKAVLRATPDYGYGPAGFPPVIPPNASLVFEVHLIAI
ncbi:peptidyl-prolyl cis-trans isomerase, partial [Clavulina sp. PMI_390]